MEKKRIFCAVQIPPLLQLLTYRDEVKSIYRLEKISWTKNENFHITLMFMGAQPVSKINCIEDVIFHAVNDLSAFELSLQGIRLFGYSYDPSIIYVGAEHPTLHTLSKRIHSGVAALGIKGQNPRYTPHVTLGRIRTNRFYQQEKEALARFNSQFVAHVNISSVNLYEAIFKSDGMQYEVLASFSLPGNK